MRCVALPTACQAWHANINAAGPLGYYRFCKLPNYVVLTSRPPRNSIIPLDGRPACRRQVHQWTGDSRGRGEGNTLVARPPISRRQAASWIGREPRVIERFTRSAATGSIRNHARRSHDVDETVDGLDSPEADSGQDHEYAPRGELHTMEGSSERLER